MTQPQHGKRRRNWRSLSLRSLIVLLTLAGVGCGLIGQRIRIQRDQSRAIKEFSEIAVAGQGVAQFGFEDPWARSRRFRWLRGKFTRATVLDMRASDALAKDYAHLIPRLPFLRNVYLGDCRANDDVVAALSKCRGVQRLELSDNLEISDECVDHLLRLKELVALNVKRTRMSWASFSRLASLPKMQTFSFDHAFSNSDLSELGRIGKLSFGELYCRSVDADGLKNLLESENIDDVWLLEVKKSRITSEWQSVLEQMKIKRLNFVGCTFAPGAFDTYQLPCNGEKPRRGWVKILASQSEFDNVVANIRSATTIHIDESPYNKRRHDHMLVTIFEPNGQKQRIAFDVNAPAEVPLIDDDVDRDNLLDHRVSVTALDSIKSVENLKVTAQPLFNQLNPELVCSAKELILLNEDPHSELSFIPFLDRVSKKHSLATESLRIQLTDLEGEDFKVIAQMSELQSLSLGSPEIDGSELVHLGSLEKLESLRFTQDCLRMEQLSVDELLERLKPLKNLRKLNGPTGWSKQKRDELMEKSAGLEF